MTTTEPIDPETGITPKPAEECPICQDRGWVYAHDYGHKKKPCVCQGEIYEEEC